MIEILDGFPDAVVAIVCKGRATRRDYETVLVPAMAAAEAVDGRQGGCLTGA